jgi:hypothetical protein
MDCIQPIEAGIFIVTSGQFFGEYENEFLFNYLTVYDE